METQTHVRANFGHFYNFADIPLDRSAHISTCGDTSSYTNNVYFNNSPPPPQKKRAKTEAGTHQLQRAYEDEGAPSAAAAHCVDGLDSDSEPAEKGWREAGKPV